MELNDKIIEYQQEVQNISIHNDKSIIITNNNTIQFYKMKKIQWECKFTDLIPIDYIDTCALSKSIILHIHSSIIFLSEDKQIQEIIQLEQEVHSIYTLNDYNVIGLFSIVNDQFSIFNTKLVQNYEFFSQQCIQFDISISFQPYRLSCFQDQRGLHLLLIRNLEHVKHYYKQIQCMDIVSINKCRNRLLILTKQQILSIFISEIENTTSEEQYLNALQLRLMNYCSSIFEGQYYFSNDSYLFSFKNDEVKYYKLIENQKNQISKIKFQEKIIYYEYVNNQLVIYSQQQQKCYLTIYNQQFEIINKYEFNKLYEGIKYCPYYTGIAIYEQKVQYQDKEPNNNYILQTEMLQKTFLQLIDFRTQIYQNNNQNNNEQPIIQSYLLYGKSKNKISCGFMLDYSIVNIQNIWNNRFIITSTYKLKIIEIYNSTYEMQHIFEFSILNQQLITFRNSLPLEDLERINFLKQTDQRILFTHFGQQIKGESKMNGIIHSFYGIKWISINKDNVNIIQLQQKQEINKIQRVLQEGSNYFYILSNDEEIYKITPDEVKLIYVSGSKLLSYVSNNNNESIILKFNNELLVTELENAQKIKYNLIL
ncbi:unnamed protein product [Paramecium primaurelia]|uniref:Uncharacterized protein n=1 Tax=Paramecium primaurelia TaxID=5886 RepID=A0A8S1N1T2_PARPR|nr:unnamed protein product [Paramecium primaurelia]